MMIRREDGATWTFDGYLGADVDGAALVAEFPLELGASASDHAQRQTETYGLQVRVTETPKPGATGPTGPERITAAADFLDACIGQWCDIIGEDRLGVITNCLLSAKPYRLDQPRHTDFSLTFRRPQQVTAQTVLIPARRIQAGPVRDGSSDETDGGKQSTKTTTTEPDVPQSTAAAALDYFLGRS